jgi:hypothetical protein
MSSASDDGMGALVRPWSSVESRVARERAERAKSRGLAAAQQALWAIECELRRSPGYPRARALDLEHHIHWRRQLDRIARASAR